MALQWRHGSSDPLAGWVGPHDQVTSEKGNLQFSCDVRHSKLMVGYFIESQVIILSNLQFSAIAPNMYSMLCCEEMRVVGFKLQSKRTHQFDTPISDELLVVRDICCSRTERRCRSQCSSYDHVITSRTQPPSCILKVLSFLYYLTDLHQS